MQNAVSPPPMRSLICAGEGYHGDQMKSGKSRSLYQAASSEFAVVHNLATRLLPDAASSETHTKFIREAMNSLVRSVTT